MLINISSNGQLGNRLQLFAHLIAYSIENNTRVINLGFREYAQYFANTEKDLLCQYPKKTLPLNSLSARNFIYKLANYAVKKNYFDKLSTSFIKTIYSHPFSENRIEFRLDDKEFLRSARETTIIITKGYFFVDYINLIKHAESIRQFFRPKRTYEENINRIIKPARLNCEILIGIHIRRGDYKDYQGGKFYYDTQVFSRLMDQLEDLFPGKIINYLLCSDEPSHEEDFSRFNITYGTNHIIEDMYALAQCDYIIGTPSTYSRWACFYGDTPVYHIIDPLLDISHSDFKTYDEIVNHHMKTASIFPRN
jgi:hypothetical protein